MEVTGQPERDRPNFRSHDRITSCGGIPNERAARRGGNSVARVESPNLLFPGRGGERAKVRAASGNYVAVDEPLFHAGVQVSLFPGFASCLINVCWIFVGFSFSPFFFFLSFFFFFFFCFVFDPC